jgi:hypothetical protein
VLGQCTRQLSGRQIDGILSLFFLHHFFHRRRDGTIVQVNVVLLHIATHVLSHDLIGIHCKLGDVQHVSRIVGMLLLPPKDTDHIEIGKFAL